MDISESQPRTRSSVVGLAVLRERSIRSFEVLWTLVAKDEAMKYQLKWFAPVLLVAFAMGCSGSAPAPTDAEMGVASPKAALAEAVKAATEDLKAEIEDEGTDGLASSVGIYLENLGGYETDAAASGSGETFAKIKAAAEELKTMASGSASKDDLKAKIDEMLKLTDELGS